MQKRRKQKMNNDQLIYLFTILLFIMISILAVLCIIFIVLKLKSAQNKNTKKELFLVGRNNSFLK